MRPLIGWGFIIGHTMFVTGYGAYEADGIGFYFYTSVGREFFEFHRYRSVLFPG